MITKILIEYHSEDDDGPCNPYWYVIIRENDRSFGLSFSRLEEATVYVSNLLIDTKLLSREEYLHRIYDPEVK